MEKRSWDFNLNDEKDYSLFVRGFGNLRGAPYEIRNNKAILYDCAILNYNAFKYASFALRSDKSFILSCLNDRVCSDVLKYVSDKLKDDKEVVLAAINRCGINSLKEEYFDLKNVSERLRQDKEVVLAALEKIDFIDSYDDLNWLISEDLMNDEDIIKLIKEYDNNFVF